MQQVIIATGAIVIAGGVTWIRMFNDAQNHVLRNINLLEYMKKNGATMDPPATVAEMIVVDTELATQKKYLRYRLWPYPPSVNWADLPMNLQFSQWSEAESKMLNKNKC